MKDAKTRLPVLLPRLAGIGLAMAGLAASPALAQQATTASQENDNGQQSATANRSLLLRGSANTVTKQPDDPFAGESVFFPASADGSGPGGANGSSTGTDGTALTGTIGFSGETQGRSIRVAGEPAIGDALTNGSPDPRASVREPAVESGTRRVEDTDPFLPQGFRAGTWTVFTRLEQAVGFATNSAFSPGGEAGAFSQTDANLRAVSNWSRHQASIEADGSFRRNLASGEEGIPQAGIKGDLRLDLVDGFAATVSGGYRYTTEALTSTSLTSTVSQRPGVHSLNGGLAVERSGGKLGLLLRGTVDRVTYDNASLSGGGTLDQSDRNNTLYQGTVRVSYESSPALQPFVQLGAGRRVYDDTVDRNGEKRSSTIVDVRGGLAIDLGEKTSGEVSLGYINENFDDANLNSLSGITLNANLDWSPERETRIRFLSATTLGGSTTAGDNGSLNQNFSLEAQRRVRDNLEFNAKASVDAVHFDTGGTTDITYTVGAGLEYWVSRFLSLTADVEHQQFESGTAGNSWNSTSVRFGVALQR
ncbi:MAG: outer membrane beta-barrel protein [Rhizobiaceae bacterium]